MSFALPELDEIGYRLWRLRRLIAVGALVPALIWLGIGLLVWPFTGIAPDGYLVLWVFAAFVLGGHAVLFPNATEETLALCLGLALMTLLEPLLGFSLWARGAELAVVMIGVAVLPNRMVAVLAQSRAIRYSATARLVTEVTAEKARRVFAPRPGQELPFRLCGQADAEGVFAVTLAPSGPIGMDADRDSVGPHVWAKVLRDDPGEQETQFLTRTEALLLDPVSLVTHSFRIAPDGVQVTEVERIDDFPIGIAALLWLTDYQQDGLVAARDAIEGRASMALRNAHRETALAAIKAVAQPGWAASRG